MVFQHVHQNIAKSTGSMRFERSGLHGKYSIPKIAKLMLQSKYYIAKIAKLRLQNNKDSIAKIAEQRLQNDC